MHLLHNYACNHWFVAKDADGKTLPVTAQLARRIGASQGQISRIEQGRVRSSDLVLEICRVLSIAPPLLSVDDSQREWVELGAALARNSPELFRTALELAEQILSTVEKKSK